MKIIVDIGHPAHVHFFKNFIWEMERRGHEILITATKKDVSLKLLDNYGFDYIAMGSYGNSLIKKMVNVPVMDFKMYEALRGQKPDILVGVAPIRTAHVSRLIRRPCIAFDDTEYSKKEIILYLPFTDVICTPSCFKKDLGKKQVRYNGYHELAYLHPNYFKPDPSVFGELGITEGEKFIIVRFVAWQASHDIGQHGFDLRAKRKLVEELGKYGRVLITSESPLPEEFEKCQITTPPGKLHDLLYYSSLCISEGGTTAVEAAVLGTPSIHVSTEARHCGNFDDLRDRYGLIYTYSDQQAALQKAMELVVADDSKRIWQRKRYAMLTDKIDVTKFMLDFIGNYPESFEEYRNNQTKIKAGK